MKHSTHRLMLLAALAFPALTACHIHNGAMDFSPVTDRMGDAVDDDVILDGDSRSISAPAPALAQAPVPAPAAPQAEAAPAPTPENPFVDTETPPPAPKPVVSAPKPAAAAGALYTVVAGDTLNGVARRHGTTPAALAAANELTPTSGLRIGQKLRLPGKAVAATPAKTPAAAPAKTPAAAPAKLPAAKGARTYSVQPGDTLYRIAAKNGTTPAALMKANGLTPQTAGKIKVGSTLHIPANR